ncbi:inclusion body family protein [Xenorhabdus sp. XENO-1]|uniref:AidA/PixA family protein n=1 Tax=Xenorhabdus bovienii TaxID=40576 RepID=UPI0020CA61DB|nr:AidA/PixA family protein [Xenorhabdus bovienii]MCP9269077.1 inclusion body family protein [Xenorhabdus bovienii subsp. africana]
MHYFLDDKKNEIIDQGGVSLTLNDVLRGDTIYWSVIKLPSYNNNYSSILTKYNKIGTDTQIMSSPDLNVKTVTIPFINNDDTKEINFTKIKNNYWVSQVISVGDIKKQDYKGYVSIYDGNGNIKGYSYFNHQLILNPPK